MGKSTKKVKPYKCATPICRNKITKWKYCRTCYNREYRKRNPIKYAYITLRSNAKRRKKVFTLTFDRFKELCYESKYIEKKGITKTSLSIDRIREEDGYTDDNVQVLPVGVNKKKHLTYDWQSGTARVVTSEISNEPVKDLPF